jgi:hypothetical protein
LNSRESSCASFYAWAAKRQHTLWLGLHSPQENSRPSKSLPDALVKRGKIQVMIYNLPFVDSNYFSQKLLDQVGVHGSKRACFFLDFMFLRVAQITAKSDVENLFRRDPPLFSQMPNLFHQIGLHSYSGHCVPPSNLP